MRLSSASWKRDEPLVEAGRDLGRLGADAGVEVVEVGPHRVDDFLGALAEPFDHFAAVGLHGAVELAEVAGDEVAERRGVARDVLRQLGAAVVEHVLERLQAGGEHFAHRVAAGADGLGERFSALSRNVSLTLLPRWTMVSVMRAPVCSSLETTSPPRRLRSSTSESPVVLSVELTSSTRVAIVSASWLPVSTTSSVSCWVRPVIMSRIAADFCEKPSATRSRRTDIMCCRLAAISVNSSPMWSVLKLRLAVRRSLAWAMASAVLGAGRFQALQQVAAALAELLDHVVAGVAERARDVLALFGQRLRDAARGVVDLLGDELADLRDVVAEIEMHAVDGVADLLGLADQRVALAAEVLQQARMRTSLSL